MNEVMTQHIRCTHKVEAISKSVSLSVTLKLSILTIVAISYTPSGRPSDIPQTLHLPTILYIIHYYDII